MDKVRKHMDKAHEVFFNTELWVAANFLNKEEIEMLISKIRPRIKMFIEKGKVNEEDNIFEIIPDKGDSQKQEEPEIDAIQNLLQDENEDSTDSEDDEPLSDNPEDSKITPSSKIKMTEVRSSEVSSNIGKSDRKRKAAAGFDTQGAVLGWLNSDEDSEDEMTDQSNVMLDSKKSKSNTHVNTTEKSKLLAEWQEDTFRKYSVKGNSKNTVVDLEDEEKGTLVNSVDDFILSLQSQRKNV